MIWSRLQSVRSLNLKSVQENCGNSSDKRNRFGGWKWYGNLKHWERNKVFGVFIASEHCEFLWIISAQNEAVYCHGVLQWRNIKRLNFKVRFKRTLHFDNNVRNFVRNRVLAFDRKNSSRHQTCKHLTYR